MKTPLALYFHWPFCQSKCPYCDFNSHVRKDYREAAYIDALSAEITALPRLFDGFSFDDYHISSIFFGGGTPSLMRAKSVETLIHHVSANFSMMDDIEITLEANPSSMEYSKFADFRAAGINRLSLGIQSLDDKILRFLERPHDAAQARQAIETAARHFDRYSFDLIYGIKDQSLSDWKDQLQEAMKLAGNHISLYQLTIEPGTNFMTRSKQGETLTLDEGAADQAYRFTLDMLESLAFKAYEISNFATSGEESRHNLSYWQYQDYLGFGAGAHSRFLHQGETHAFHRIRLPERWLAAVTEQGGAASIAQSETLTSAQIYQEICLMGLRLSQGIDESYLIARTQMGFDHLTQAALNDFIKAGWLEVTPKKALRATPKGRIRLDSILTELL